MRREEEVGAGEGGEGGGWRGRGGKDIRARKTVISLPYYNDAIRY